MGGHFNHNLYVPDYSVAEIRPIAQQSLVALKALKSMGLVHADIKPNNLMFVNPGLYPFKVKPIDFGLARKISDLKSTSQIQPLGYKAPEVVFGLPMNESVDMWDLGCSLGYMYLFEHLFTGNCEYEYIANVQMQGVPPEDVLQEGSKSTRLF
uniref:Protein kinase domain-containing protein n=1 Tax=Oryzias melastigma TaxID=30732 RepID=A0A3B3BDS9_ORYME